MELGFAPKMVVTLSTTRTENAIRNAMSRVEQMYRDRILGAISADPQTSLVRARYRLDVKKYEDGTAQVYPKLHIVVDTTRTEEAVESALSVLYDSLKADIRTLVAASPQTSIITWHVHRDTGSVDEDEP